MTKQEAVEICKEVRHRLWILDEQKPIWDKGTVSEALNMAMEALEQIESGRYIKGECSICQKEYGTLGCCTTVSNHWTYSCREGMAQYAKALQQEPKRGEWIRNDNGTYSCSLCQSWIPEAQYHYAQFCLHCGADMRDSEWANQYFKDKAKQFVEMWLKESEEE